jgi:biotin carboxyl carrier protein
MVHVTVENSVYEVQQDLKGNWLINDEPFAWDIVQTSAHHYHILLGGKSYSAEIEQVDMESKTLSIKVNGQTIKLTAKDRFDLLLEKMGMSKSATKKINELKAPMPGAILELTAKEGDVVKKGDKLLILEAMKMENVLKSPTDGVVKAVKVKKGENVEKNHVLLTFQ